MSSKHVLRGITVALGLWGAVNTCLAGFNYVSAGIIPSLVEGLVMAGPLVGSLICLGMARGTHAPPREIPHLPPLLKALACLWQSHLGENVSHLWQSVSRRGVPLQASFRLTFSDGSQYSLTWSARQSQSAAKTEPATSAGRS